MRTFVLILALFAALPAAADEYSEASRAAGVGHTEVSVDDSSDSNPLGYPRPKPNPHLVSVAPDNSFRPLRNPNSLDSSMRPMRAPWYSN